MASEGDDTLTISEELRGIANYDQVLEKVLLHFGVDGGTIHMLNEDGDLALMSHSKGMPEPVLAAIRIVPPGKGMAGVAFESNDVVDTCNLQQDAGTGPIRSGAKATGFGGSVVVPIRDQDDKPIGTLGIATAQERVFTPEEHADLLACGKAIGCSR